MRRIIRLANPTLASYLDDPTFHASYNLKGLRIEGSQYCGTIWTLIGGCKEDSQINSWPDSACFCWRTSWSTGEYNSKLGMRAEWKVRRRYWQHDPLGKLFLPL